MFVTHDLSEALLLADRIVFMVPKHIECIVDVDFPRPRNLEKLSLDPHFREMRSELMELFYMDECDEIDSGSPHNRREVLTNDDPDGILHYDNVQGGT